MEYKPDNWVLLRFNIANPTGKPYYKILGGWSGGYLEGNYWRLNSGVKAVVDEGAYWRVLGYSGSEYICYKQNEQVRMNIANTLEYLLKHEEVTQISMEEYFKENAERTETN